MKDILLYIWQLPQHLVALIIYLINIKNVEKTTVRTSNGNGDLIDIDVYIVDYCMNCGVSLGNYIFLDRFIYDKTSICNKMSTVLHEYGHSKQSKMLGWLYLIIVGFTSAVFNNLWDRLFHKNWNTVRRSVWYYNRFPEKWADKLGEVNRWVKGYIDGQN